VASPALRLCVAFNAAALLSFLAFGVVPDDLDVRTDIVGYPTYANFNVNRYFWAYGFVVVVFPLLTFAIYLALTRVFTRSEGPRGPIPPPLERVETTPRASGRRALLVAAGRTLLVAFVLGLEVVVVSELLDNKALFVLTAIGYCAAVASLAWGASRIARRDLLDVVSTVNIAAAPLVLALLYGVSESTQVTVTATGAVHHYPWLPLWSAVALTAGVLVWLVRGLRRSRSSHRSDVERRALLLVTAPVGLFLLVAYLPGDLGTINLFEEGQVLAGAELTRDGAFPWRDLLVVHGLLHDIGTGLFGSAVIEDSRWGVVAGEQLLILPLSWVALYYLCAYLFWSNWLFLLGTQLLVVTGGIFAIHYRLGLIPLVLLLLAALLNEPTVIRAVAFAALLFAQVVVTPEAISAAPMYMLVIVLFELTYRDRTRRIVENFRRSLLTLASAGVLGLGWSVFLLAFGALDDFVFSYQAFVPGHQLTGGVPLGTYLAVLSPGNVGEHYEEFAILTPVVLILAAFLYFVARIRQRRPLFTQDWVMLAAVAFVLTYYAKFLSRTDHVYHSFAMAAPGLLYAIYRVITLAERRLAGAARTSGGAWFPARHVITLPVLLVLLASAPVALDDAVRSVQHHFAPDVSEEPELDALGYARKGENDLTMFREVSRALESQIEPGDTIFDFSNTPGLFHYLLDVPASNRYYHVSIAIRQRTQTDLIRLLEARQPKVVVFSSAGVGGSPSVWDKIANQVRHYDVSEYLLDHYVPVLESNSFVFMRRREGGVTAVPELYFRTSACDWGFTPSFLSPAPSPMAGALDVPFQALDPALRIRGWAVDVEARKPAKEVVATRDGKVVARVLPDQRRPDVAFQLNHAGYRDSGFGIVLAIRNESDRDLGRIRLFVVMRSGDRKELFVTPGVETEQSDSIDLVDGRGALASEPRGAVEAAGVEKPLALRLPAEAGTYRWLELNTGETVREASFELSDRLDESPFGQRIIAFKTLARDETSTRIRVGACSQWRGYSRDVYLTTDPAQDIREVRLLR